VPANKGGLEDVVACATEICFIDGQAGRLVYRGYDVGDIVRARLTYEDVSYLLWHGALPTAGGRLASTPCLTR